MAVASRLRGRDAMSISKKHNQRFRPREPLYRLRAPRSGGDKQGWPRLDTSCNSAVSNQASSLRLYQSLVIRFMDAVRLRG